MSEPIDELFSMPGMSAAFSSEAHVRGMLAFEAALASHLGRPEAQRIVQAACDYAIKAGRDLRQITLEDTQVRAFLSPEEIDQALDPTRYLVSTDAFIDRALAAWESGRRPGDS